MPRKSSVALSPPKGDKSCCFCGLKDDNELDYGKIHEYSGIITHYYCLLFSSNMQQQGLDDEGILGFLPGDIHKELKRGKRLVCSYCKKAGATLGCCNTRCKKIFHFPCGLKAGSLHQFFGEFRSYCVHHRPKQIIEDRIANELSQGEKKICYICYDEVNPKDDLGTIWAPCCKKNAWFHRTCVQQLAISAGYFFKCPLCNNKTEFQRAMLDHGIFIPSQDASWELVPNAFQELLYRHNRCDAEKCVCPKGREYTSTNAKWELTLCRTCGSQGMHMACGNLKWGEPVWECNECISILNKSMTATETLGLSNFSSSNQASPIDNNSSDDENSSDSEISVGSCTEFFTQISNPTVESQSSSLFPKTRNTEEKSPEKQRRDDIGNTVTTKSPRKVSESQETRDDRENNEELAPLTKKPRILVEQGMNKDDSDDDVIVVSGPSRKEQYRTLDVSWMLQNSRKTQGTGEDMKKQLNKTELQSNPNNVIQEVTNVEKKVSTSSTGSLTNPKVQFPVSRNEKRVPIEIDLSDGETAPTTSSSTASTPKTSTTAKTLVPELNIQITNVTSLAPEAFATVPESCDGPRGAEKTASISVTEKPKSVSAPPVYQRLEIVRLEAQPAADNLPKPVIYGITIPGTNTTVPLIITTAEAPQSSPAASSNKNSPVPPSLSRLAGPKSRKAAILAAAAAQNSTIHSNASSVVEVPKSTAATARNNDVSAITSPNLTQPTIQRNERSNIVTVDLTSPKFQNNKIPIVNASQLIQNHERPIGMAPQSTVPTISGNVRPLIMTERSSVPTMRNEDGSIVIAPKIPVPTTQGKERCFLLAQKSTPATIPSNEDSAVLSAIPTASRIQNNQRPNFPTPNSTTPTIQNNQKSNTITVTNNCNNEPTVTPPKLMGTTIRSSNRWPLLAPKPTTPTIQSNESSNNFTHDPSKLSSSKLSYSLPLEAVVNDQILHSRAGRKVDTKNSVSCEKNPLRKNSSVKSTSLQKNQDPTNGTNSIIAPEVSAASSKNVPPTSLNGFVSSRKICLLTPKSDSLSSPDVPPINSNPSTARKDSHSTFLVGNTCVVQNGDVPEISDGDNSNKILLSDGVPRSFDNPRNNVNGSDSMPTGSRTNSQPQKIPTTPHSKDSHAEDKKSLGSPENCDGDAGTSSDVPFKCAIPTNIQFNGATEANTQSNIGGRRNGNDVSKDRGTEILFRNGSQYDAQKNETTECSTAADRADSGDRIGLINKMINLRDLKFTVCGSNIVKMTLYETYCVNMKIENGKKRKFASSKSFEISKKNNSDLLIERTENLSLLNGGDILRNADDKNGLSGSLASSCAFSSDENSEKGAVSQSSNHLQSNAVMKVAEVVPSDSTRENINSRGQDELKENLDPVPSSTNIRTTSPIERKSKTRLRNGGVNTMQLLNERDAKEKIIDEKIKSSPQKIGTQDPSLGTSKMSYNDKKEVACVVARNLFISNDEEANNSRCENTAKKCKTRLNRANDKISEGTELSPKRAKYGKFEDFNDEIPLVNNSRIDNSTFGHVVIAEKLRSRKSSRVSSVCKNEKPYSNHGPKNGLRPSRAKELKSNNSVCCKVSIDLAKIRSVITSKIHFFDKIENHKFHKFPKKNERTKYEEFPLIRKFHSFDNLIIDNNHSSSIERSSMVQTRRWKSHENLLSFSKLDDTYDRCNGISYGENTRRGHKRKSRSFEKHDCVR